ncbi:hypothetical protein ANCCAN_02327 [Ancylostoma caninum]|uniref:Uncharacterized protein n=1 Tax=Ancylostoma caninum TaxID=29170 RepID=A0A368H7R8_ANCCA|nr:hypothetical protein ANCCAN_02327 [Ancylostoma caninum]
MLGTRYGVLCKGRFVSTGPIEMLQEHRSKLCVLQVELMDSKKKQKVLDTVHDVFPKSVPIPTPGSTKHILKWHIPMSEGESLSVFFRKTQQLVNFVPVTNLILSEASYGDALQRLSDKFSNLQKKSSTKELVNRLLTVIT